MFNLDIKVFKICYEYCDQLGRGFGFNGALEGAIIIGFVVVGTVLIAISKVENKKC